MAKIVVINVPGHGHVNPTLPVIAELRRRGHQVIYYNTEDFRAKIERTGAEFRPYPASTLSTMNDAELAQGSLIQVTQLIFRASVQLVPFMTAELQRELPDLVIYDSICLWGMLAARQLKLPTVASITTFVLEGAKGLMSWREYVLILSNLLKRLPSFLGDRAKLVKSLGTENPLPSPIFPCTGDLNIVFTSKALQPESSFVNDSFEFVGTSIDLTTREDASSFPLDQVIEQRQHHPIIYISMGTINNNNLDFYRQCFSTFADHRALFVLSVGKKIDIASLGTIPQNFIVRQYAPQLKLLPHVDLFITHAGMNSLQESLYYGVPMVMIPQQLEQLANANVVARRGAGVTLGHVFNFGKVTSPQLLETVNRLINEPEFRAAAQEIAASLRGSGGYLRAADLISIMLSNKVQQPAAVQIA